jgi:hypothetical protein
MKTIIDFANKVKSLADGRMTNIANVEESPSTHPYAVGKQLIFNGLLCKATSAISVGDTLAVGTNLALSDNVVEQIYSLNQGLTNSLANISHENLLENPWFTVNQRGQSSYGANTFSLDRWKSGNNNQVAISGNVVTLSPVNTSQSCVFYQVFEDEADGLNGKTVTLSLLDGSGNLYTVSHVVEHKTTWTQLFLKGFNDSFSIGLTAQPFTDGKYRYSFDITTYATKTLTIKAVKLELGSVSTLAMDTAPNYQQELAKCQRYYEQNSWYSWNVKANLDGVIDIMTSYPFLVKKRVNNITTNILKQNIGNGQLIDLTTSTNIPSNEVTISQPMAYNSRMECIKITHNSIISGHTYFFSIGDDCIAFSADL